MTVSQAILLGVVQGITEFLPISSQAHLYLIPYFFGWDYQGLNFDIALHAGTLLAVVLIFGKDYWKYLKAIFSGSPESQSDKKIAWYLVIGSVPAALAGVFLQNQAETTFRNPWIMVFTLIGFGILLWASDKYPQKLGTDSLNWKKSLFVGVAQAIAIIPGVSRSGSTLTAGRLLGLDRPSAARFSFLLSGPIIFGAALVVSFDQPEISAQLLFGFLSAAVSGALAIKFLLSYLTRRGFGLFVWYRVVLAIIMLTKLLT